MIELDYSSDGVYRFNIKFLLDYSENIVHRQIHHISRYNKSLYSKGIDYILIANVKKNNDERSLFLEEQRSNYSSGLNKSIYILTIKCFKNLSLTPYYNKHTTSKSVLKIVE